MNIRTTLQAFAAAALLASTAQAQGLLLRVDRATGAMTLTGTDATAVNLGGYRIGSVSGSIVPDDFDGVRNDVPDWVLTGTPDVNGVEELLADAFASTPVNDSVTFSLGAAYDPVQAMLSAGFGVDVEQNDLTLLYYDTVRNTTLGGSIEYLGEKKLNNIGITVDLADGSAILENDSPFDQVITGYLIEAATEGSLTTDLNAFDGVRNEIGGDAFEAPFALDGSNLGELDPTGAGISLDAGQSYSLGAIGGLNGDLSFSFLLAGVGESSRIGFVKYLNAGSAGDFNGDDHVDGLDFLAWQRGESPQPLSTLNLAAWRSTFGSSPPAAVQAIPEPASAMLAMITLLGSFISGRGARQRD